MNIRTSLGLFAFISLLAGCTTPSKPINVTTNSTGPHKPINPSILHSMILNDESLSGSKCLIWLRADKDVITDYKRVKLWQNQINTTPRNPFLDFWQNDTNKQPLLIDSAINKRPAVKFDGVNDWLTCSNSGIGSCKTIVSVCQMGSPIRSSSKSAFNPPNTIVGNQGNSRFSAFGIRRPILGLFRRASYVWTDNFKPPQNQNQTYTLNAPLSGPYNPLIIAVTHDAGTGHSGNVDIYVNGNKVASNHNTLTTSVLGISCVGGGIDFPHPTATDSNPNGPAYDRAGDLFAGDICEIFAFDTALNENAIKNLSEKLRQYWGP